jgi:predicted MPP superfamily phosphohydrolase
MKVVHISDLHHAKHDGVKKLITDLISHYQGESEKPKIVLSGDLVHSSLNKRKMFEVKKYLKNLIDNDFELFICPGNHDLKIKGVFGNPIKTLSVFNKYFSPLLPQNSNYNGAEDNDLLHYPLVHKYDNHFFIGLNSLQKNAKFARGRLGKRQIQELNETIDGINTDFENPVIIVYLHHNPFYFSYKYDSLKLENRKLFLEVIRGINVLLFGHYHKNIRYKQKESDYDINCIQLTGYSTLGIHSHWTEIDTETYKTTEI